MVTEHRKYLDALFDDEFFIPKVIINGNSSVENYSVFLLSIRQGMDEEYGEGNYVIEDKVVVY
mgnify:CR=1 FL=1